MTSGVRLSFWDSLSAADRVGLAALGAVRGFPAGTVIVRQDERTDFGLVVRRGCVKVSILGQDGYEAVLALRDAGDLVGELAGVDGGPRSASLHALTDVEALVLPADRFGAFRAARPEVERTIQRMLSARLRDADRARAEVGADAVPRRLSVLLLRLADRYGRPEPEGGIRIELPLSQDDLAGLVLTTRRTIGRVLELWRGRGWVHTGRRHVVVLDPAALVRLATV